MGGKKTKLGYSYDNLRTGKGSSATGRKDSGDGSTGVVESITTKPTTTADEIPPHAPQCFMLSKMIGPKIESAPDGGVNMGVNTSPHQLQVPKWGLDSGWAEFQQKYWKFAKQCFSSKQQPEFYKFIEWLAEQEAKPAVSIPPAGGASSAEVPTAGGARSREESGSTSSLHHQSPTEIDDQLLLLLMKRWNECEEQRAKRNADRAKHSKADSAAVKKGKKAGTSAAAVAESAPPVKGRSTIVHERGVYAEVPDLWVAKLNRLSNFLLFRSKNCSVAKNWGKYFVAYNDSIPDGDYTYILLHMAGELIRKIATEEDALSSGLASNNQQGKVEEDTERENEQAEEVMDTEGNTIAFGITYNLDLNDFVRKRAGPEKTRHDHMQLGKDMQQLSEQQQLMLRNLEAKDYEKRNALNEQHQSLNAESLDPPPTYSSVIAAHSKLLSEACQVYGDKSLVWADGRLQRSPHPPVPRASRYDTAYPNDATHIGEMLLRSVQDSLKLIYDFKGHKEDVCELVPLPNPTNAHGENCIAGSQRKELINYTGGIGSSKACCAPCAQVSSDPEIIKEKRKLIEARKLVEEEVAAKKMRKKTHRIKEKPAEQPETVEERMEVARDMVYEMVDVVAEEPTYTVSASHGTYDTKWNCSWGRTPLIDAVYEEFSAKPAYDGKTHDRKNAKQRALSPDRKLDNLPIKAFNYFTLNEMKSAFYLDGVGPPVIPKPELISVQRRLRLNTV